MRVIFLENLKGIAQIGDIKNVSDGYARNFLFPKSFAKPATVESVKQAETLRNKRLQEYALDKENALSLIKKLETLVLKIDEDANSEGHLYGSVGEKEIAKAIKKEGMNIPPEKINLAEKIKTIGEHEVELALHPEVKIKIKVLVSAKSH